MHKMPRPEDLTQKLAWSEIIQSSNIIKKESLGLKTAQRRSVQLIFMNPESKNDVILIPLNTPTEVNIKEHQNIYIKDRILKVRTQSGKTFLVGKKEGLTLLKAGGFEYPVKILSLLDWGRYSEFQKQFKNHPSLKLKYINNDLSIYGELLTQTDVNSLFKWMQSHKSEAELKIQFNLSFNSIELKKYAIEKLSEILNSNILDLTSSLQLSLKSVPSEELKKRILSMGFLISPRTLDGATIGFLNIKFINVSDSKLETITSILPNSFQWTLGDKINILSQVINSEYSELVTDNNTSSRIDLMLFENEKTEYHSGGEFAINQQSIYRNDIQWKSYGLFIEAHPLSETNEEINLFLKVKFSYLISSDLTQPSLSQESWVQRLKLKHNQTMVISNNLTQMTSKNKGNNLFLKSIPLLGALFKSKTLSSEKSNVYMLISLNKPDLGGE